MTIWEYYSSYIVEQHVYYLNKLGEEGWELINILPDKSNYYGTTYYFKRIKDTASPKIYADRLEELNQKEAADILRREFGGQK